MARVLKIGVYDPAYLARFYRDRPGLDQKSYADQHATLIADRAASSDFWSRALIRLGHEQSDVIANVPAMQRQWAAENGAAFDDVNYVFQIAPAQVQAYRPEVVIMADHLLFDAGFLRHLRENCSSIRLIIGWCGAPYRDLLVMREWDIALSCIPELVTTFREQGIEAHHVDHGFDPVINDELSPPQSVTGFSFVGSVINMPGFHQARAELLTVLVKATPLEIWSPAGNPPLGSLARRAARRIIRGKPKHALDPALKKRLHPPVHGLAMFARLRDSGVTLNTHIDLSAHNASNMRLFEATGVGTCLLTDHKPDIARLFEPDSEVVTYSSAAEAIEKYRYLSEHPDVRREIARAGQRRALRDHNFDNRAARIDEIIAAGLRRA